jgi:ABC-type transporter Mla subunit MlaD
MPLQPELDCSDLNDHENQIDETLVQAAITTWRSSPKGSGNNNFFQFALELRKAGMNKAQIENMLQSEAAFAHSPNERKAQISSIIKSLQKSNKASRRRIV